MAQVGVAQKQVKDVKQILLSYLACRQIWLNYSYRLSSLWLRHKIAKNILGLPCFQEKPKRNFFFSKAYLIFYPTCYRIKFGR